MAPAAYLEASVLMMNFAYGPHLGDRSTGDVVEVCLSKLKVIWFSSSHWNCVLSFFVGLYSGCAILEYS